MKTNIRGYEMRAVRADDTEFNPSTWFKTLVRNQDLRYWKIDPQGFDKWVKDSLKSVIDNIQFVIE